MTTRIRLAPAGTRQVRRGLERRLRRSLGVDVLEPRRMLAAIDPALLYTSASFTNSHGDTVDISVQGSVSATNAGFTLALAGGATDNADVSAINLLGLNDGNSLSIRVTPNPLTITGGGGNFVQIFSSGYVNVTRISSTADPRLPNAAPLTSFGGFHLSAAVVKNIALPGVTIGEISVDTGKVPYVDRVNASNLNGFSFAAPSVTATGNASVQEILDESPTGQAASYAPRTGLIGLRNVTAKAVTQIVIDGAAPLSPNNEFDTSNTTNDFNGRISVSGAIGSIVGAQSVLKGNIFAGSIGKAEFAAINGSIRTSDPTSPFTISLPVQFSGTVNSAGHLNLGFPHPTMEVSGGADASAAIATLSGRIVSAGGISGIDATTTADPIVVPGGYSGVVTNRSLSAGIADLVINGVGRSSWTSASSVGAISADLFTKSMIVRAGSDIGNIQSTAVLPGASTAQQPNPAPLAMEGLFQAARDIGDVESTTGINASLIAGRNIGSITSASGGLGSTVISAGRDIGMVTALQAVPGTTPISAGGTLAGLHLRSGSWSGAVSAQEIGSIVIDSGSLQNAFFSAAGSIGSVTVKAPVGIAIDRGALVAGSSIGAVTATAAQSAAIRGTLIQAGAGLDDSIASITALSGGTPSLPIVAPNPLPVAAATSHGIDGAQILAGAIGPIRASAHGGTGLVDSLIHAQAGDIASITGGGNAGGLLRVTAVAEGAIGDLSGAAWAQGRGISGSSFDANGGSIGLISGVGGPAGGAGIDTTTVQALTRVAGISGTSNANGGDAVSALTATAASFGEIRASVLGGRLGNGLVDSQIKAWTNYAGVRPPVQLDGIFADVRSATGAGILRTRVNFKGDLVALVSKALSGPAISASTFDTSSGDFGRISAESVNAGTAIDASFFTAQNGSIGSAQSEADAAAKGIVAVAGASSPLANAIAGSFFTADGNIGYIVASANGGSGITGSTFLADADAGNSNNGPNLQPPAPSDDLGAIFGVHATSSGQGLTQSTGINASTFTGESILAIVVDVKNREEGGAGIIASTFTARNAVADGSGNFDNAGAIGAITVTNNSLRGNGIETSRFYAGAAGSIGDITVTTLGGTGIKGSYFQASGYDLDQNRFTSTIGNIKVRAGRTSAGIVGLVPPNDSWTMVAAGIDSSYFASNAGIGNVDVVSVGTSIFFSAFLANFDILGLGAPFPYSLVTLLGRDVPGNIGNVTVTSTGRFGSGVVFSAFHGTGIGSVQVNVSSPNLEKVLLPTRSTDAENPILKAENALEKTVGSVKAFSFGQQDRYGLVGVGGSLFVATNSGIGLIRVINASATGISSVFSAYVSLGASGSYGPLTLNPAAPTVSVGWWIFRADVPTNLFWGKAKQLQLGSGSSSSLSPTVTKVTLPAAGRYKAGSDLLFTLTFARPVMVVGSPSFPVALGGASRDAAYVGGTGTDTLTFKVSVVAGDNAPAGITLPQALSESIDNRICDLASEVSSQSLDLPAVDGTTVIVDTVAPGATSLIQPAYGPYSAGKTVEARVRFSEAVVVSGVPTLPLLFGTTQRTMRFQRVDGADVVFSYVVTAKDVSLRRHARTSGLIGLPAGSKIADLAGTTAMAQAAPLADPQAPVVVGILSATGPAAGPRKAGDRISVTVNFEAPVSITGRPTLAFTIGGTARAFTYLAGSGTKSIVFSYVLTKSDLAAGVIAIGRTLAVPTKSAIRGFDGVSAATSLPAWG